MEEVEAVFRDQRLRGSEYPYRQEGHIEQLRVRLVHELIRKHDIGESLFEVFTLKGTRMLCICFYIFQP